MDGFRLDVVKHIRFARLQKVDWSDAKPHTRRKENFLLLVKISARISVHRSFYFEWKKKSNLFEVYLHFNFFETGTYDWKFEIVTHFRQHAILGRDGQNWKKIIWKCKYVWSPSWILEININEIKSFKNSVLMLIEVH